MKITLKTLKGQQLPLEVEPTTNVADLKAQIAETHGMPAETQKLIAYGKVMDDDAKTVADYKIAENGFIVVMTVKAKPVRPPAEDAKQEEVAQPGVTLPAQAEQPAAAGGAQPQPPAAQPQPSQQPQPVAQPSNPAPSTSTALPPGVDEEAVSTIVGITGKPRDMCIQALQLTQGNADMACSLLFEGVTPEQLQQMAAGAGQPGGGMPGMDGGDDYGDEYGQDPGAGQPMAGGMPGGAGGMGAMAELMNNPQMPMIAERLRSNPQFYQEFMTRLSTQNPALFAQIQANPMAFMNLVMGGNPNIGLGMPGGPGGAGGPGAGGMPGMPGAGAGQPRRPPPGSIQVSAQEMEAIQRLQALGFSQHRAAEAYLSCDKNEEMAANFLFESGMEDDDAQMQAALAQSAAASNPAPGGDAQPQPNPPADGGAEAQAQPNPPAAEAQAQPDQPAAEQQPAAAEQQQEQPAANNAGGDVPMDGGNNNNNDGNGNGGAGEGGAGDGGERSAFE